MPREPPEPQGPLQAALRDSTVAATTRASEGHALFSPIAVFLDNHRREVSDLNPHLRRALASLSDDLASVAQRHFDAFICGVPAPRATENACPPAQSQHALPPQRSLPPATPGLAQSTYASAVSRPAPAAAFHIAKLPKQASVTKPTPKLPGPDRRLFVRLADSHRAKSMQAYAIYSSLRAKLGSNGTALKEVQSTKTGFALCPSSPEALSILEAQKESILDFFGVCHVERNSHWVSFRVTNVPRSVGHISPDGEHTLVPVDSTILACAVSESIGITPIAVTETPYSTSNPYLASSSWFVNFPEGTNASVVPHQLRLFGIVTTARLLARKTTIVQCSRCWDWHNTRCCARPPKCRLCGSSEHLEEGHHNRCDAPSPHQCPSRCLHCHGPHPADSPTCLLRPGQGRTALTKAQKLEIRKSCSAALSQARLEKGCQTHTPPPSLQAVSTQDDMAIDTTATPVRSTTPFSQPPPPSPQAVSTQEDMAIDTTATPIHSPAPFSQPLPRTTTPSPRPSLRAPPSTNRSTRYATRSQAHVTLGEEL
jgi:hypothetical protein